MARKTKSTKQRGIGHDRSQKNMAEASSSSTGTFSANAEKATPPEGPVVTDASLGPLPLWKVTRTKKKTRINFSMLSFFLFVFVFMEAVLLVPAFFENVATMVLALPAAIGLLFVLAMGSRNMENTRKRVERIGEDFARRAGMGKKKNKRVHTGSD